MVIAPGAASHEIGGTHGHSLSVLELMVSRRGSWLIELSEYFLLVSSDNKVELAALVLVAVTLAPHNG